MRAPKARVAFAIALAGLAAAPAAAQAGQGRKPVPAAGPQITHNAKDKGATPNAAAQSLRVYLAPKGGEDALKAAVDAVSTPGSATLRALPHAGAVPRAVRPDGRDGQDASSSG